MGVAQRADRGARSTVAAVGVTVAAVLPAFLTGGMAVQMSRDLGFDAAELGASMSAFIAAQAVLSRWFGRWADRVGAPPALRLSALLSAGVAVFAAVWVHDWLTLTLALAAAGAANALGQPSASRLIAHGVRQGRQGLAFGVFQSSKPAAGLLGGLAVPVFALTVGWRWAFVAAAVFALAIALLVPSAEGRGRTGGEPAGPPASLPRVATLLLITGMAFGFGAVKVFSTFVVDAGVTAGVPPSAAGVILAAASALAIATRLSVGVLADRREGDLMRAVAVMLLLGALGFAALAAQRPAAILVGSALVAAGAWGYNGLFYLSMTRMLADAPARMAGLVLAGSSIGGAVAPPVFGLVAERTAYGPAWLLVAAWTALGAVSIRAGAAVLARRSHTEPALGKAPL